MAGEKKPRRAYGKGIVGVTTVIGQVLAKPQLLFWAAKEGAAAAAAAVAGGMAVDDAVELGRKAHMRKRDEAADVGTLAHGLIERWLARESVAVDLSNDQEARAHAAASRIIDWVEGAEERGDLEVLASEPPLVDEMSGYGGTLDMVVRLRTGEVVIVDFKTGKAIYDEVAIQLGAYRCLWDLHNPSQRVSHALVLHSPPDGELATVEVQKPVLDVGATIFAALLHVYRNKGAIKIKQESSDAAQ